MRIMQVKIIHKGSTPDLEEAMNQWFSSMADQEINIIDIKYTHVQTHYGGQFVAYIQYK